MNAAEDVVAIVAPVRLPFSTFSEPEKLVPAATEVVAAVAAVTKPSAAVEEELAAAFPIDDRELAVELSAAATAAVCIVAAVEVVVVVLADCLVYGQPNSSEEEAEKTLQHQGHAGAVE